ncbi:MAG: chorismate synthase [Solirubrobacteraceae bacterium]|nr:chorismate synthase [Patulibacter sp.]
MLRALRFVTAGESHGPGLTAIVEGMPAGLELDRDTMDHDMVRRQSGHGRGGRMKIEKDHVVVTSGVRFGKTLGGPISITVPNRDYANWEGRMNPWPVDTEPEPVKMPRPGHADLVGVWKYGADDVRNILERASARETAARVAGGTVARAFLKALGVEIRSRVTQIGPVHAPALDAPLSVDDFDGVDDDPVRCLDPEASRAMVKHITAQRKANESIGGTYEVQVFGVVPGLGSHVSWEDRLGGRLAAAICSIQAHKGVEFGDGFELAAAPGSQAHDEIFNSPEEGVHRVTNHSGGMEGGMSTGQPIVLRAAVKPIPTLTKPLRSIDLDTGEPAQALRERTDSCVVPAAGVVGEAMVALVIADAYRQKFGGDHIDDVIAAVDAYRERIGWQTAVTGG